METKCQVIYPPLAPVSGATAAPRGFDTLRHSALRDGAQSKRESNSG